MAEFIKDFIFSIIALSFIILFVAFIVAILWSIGFVAQIAWPYGPIYFIVLLSLSAAIAGAIVRRSNG